MPDELAPHSVAEITEYYARMRPQLQVGAQAREAASFVIHPPMPRKVALADPGPAGLVRARRPGVWRCCRAGRAGCTGSRASRLTDLATTLGVRALHNGLTLVPRAQREGPALTAAKKRLGLS